MNIKHFFIFLTLFLCSHYVAAQNRGESFANSVMAVSYDTGAGMQQIDGTSKAESYDVAIKLQDVSLVGKQIVGLRIPIINADGLANLSGWLSTELKLEEIDETMVNVPSIATKAAELSTGWSEVIFDEPYVITEDGVYAGYSFDIEKSNNQNLKPISTTSEINEYGYYLHTSRTRKYKEWYCPYNANEDKGSLRLQVMVAGMDGNAASVELYPLVNIQSGAEASVPATLYCHGFNGISSIDYEYESGTYKGKGSLQLESPVEASYNKFAKVDLPIDPINELGEFNLSVTITKVNGEDNSDSQASASCKVYVYDFVPVHIPLVEEYSGTWCGNCVRGIASMELMKERHGDDFICLTYHNEDPMAISMSYPSEIRGFPDCWIDRTKNTDPFFGDRSDGQYHFEEEWSNIKITPASVALDVETEWVDEDETKLKAKASLRSQKEYFDNEITLGFVLVADDLYGTRWAQTNYYSGDDTCEELAEMANASSKIYGLHYNDVVILGENVDGLSFNLPENIKPLTEYNAEYTFDLTKAVNTDGESLVQNRNKLKVVIIAINTNTGKVENCCQSPYMISAALESLYEEGSQLIETEYYDISGIRIKNPSKGIYFEKLRYADGKVKTQKIILH